MQQPHSRPPQRKKPADRPNDRQATQNEQRRRTAVQQRRKKRMMQRRLVTAGMVLVALLIVLTIVLIIRGILKKNAPEPEIPSSISVSSVPEISEEPSSAEPIVTRTKTPYDEEIMPDLFNYENYIPENYSLDLIDVGSGQQMQRKAGEAFIDMFNAAKTDGITLTPVSGYRTHDRQKNNYNASIQRYVDQGLSQDDAISRTQQYYAIPGTSEHEAGVAMDIGWITDDFENSDAFAWLQKNAETYGFIMRYASDTYDITRINYEPWHYRYVGANHAEKINELGITLEEYYELLYGMG